VHPAKVLNDLDWPIAEWRVLELNGARADALGTRQCSQQLTASSVGRSEA
jgi:hypothetical protein